MKLYDAKVADILRCTQRDQVFVSGVEDQLQSFLKLFGGRNYHQTRRRVPVIANVWYYLMTSFGNLQTLGEEYTGTIRVNNSNKIPSKLITSIWLMLYIGGEPLLDRLLNSLEVKITNSPSLTNEARNVLLKTIDFLKNQKGTIQRVHHALFYIDGKYYNIANRVLNIRYGLVRQWMQDDSFTGSFSFLGNVSIFYILFNFIQKLWFSQSSGNVHDPNIANTANVSKRTCILCAENLKSPCATPCGHIFCWSCINDSLSYQKNCPICRQEVKSSRIVFLQNFL